MSLCPITALCNEHPFLSVPGKILSLRPRSNVTFLVSVPWTLQYGLIVWSPQPSWSFSCSAEKTPHSGLLQ